MTALVHPQHLEDYLYWKVIHIKLAFMLEDSAGISWQQPCMLSHDQEIESYTKDSFPIITQQLQCSITALSSTVVRQMLQSRCQEEQDGDGHVLLPTASY